MKQRFITVLLLYMAVSMPGVSARAADFQNHGYLLASFGKADTRYRTTITDEVNGDDDAFEIGVGFAFSPYLSVEGSYQDFGEPYGYAGCPIDVFCIAVAPFSREKVSVNGWSAALRGAVPLTDRFSIFARLGFVSWDASASSAGLNDSGTDLLFGGGVAADLSDRFGVQLSYEKANVDIETVKVGVRVGF